MWTLYPFFGFHTSKCLKGGQTGTGKSKEVLGTQRRRWVATRERGGERVYSAIAIGGPLFSVGLDSLAVSHHQTRPCLVPSLLSFVGSLLLYTREVSARLFLSSPHIFLSPRHFSFPFTFNKRRIYTDGRTDGRTDGQAQITKIGVD
jgi:hypothetical protein